MNSANRWIFLLIELNSYHYKFLLQATSIGAIYEQAKQIVNPEDDEQQFQSTLISAVRDRLGVQPRYEPPEIKAPKKASYKSRKGVAASSIDQAITGAV